MVTTDDEKVQYVTFLWIVLLGTAASMLVEAVSTSIANCNILRQQNVLEIRKEFKTTFLDCAWVLRLCLVFVWRT